MRILEEKLGKSAEHWKTDEKCQGKCRFESIVWSFLFVVVFFCLFVLSFFNMFAFLSPNTIKRNKSRLNKRLNPGLKSACFLTFFSNVQQISQVASFKISILQQNFFFFFMFILFVQSILLSLCFPVVFMFFFVVSDFFFVFSCVFGLFFFNIYIYIILLFFRNYHFSGHPKSQVHVWVGSHTFWPGHTYN